MKKMWMIAAVACAALMVACGGEQKPAEAAVEAPATEEVAPAAEATPAAEAAPATEAAPAAEAAAPEAK